MKESKEGRARKYSFEVVMAKFKSYNRNQRRKGDKNYASRTMKTKT